MTKRTEEARKKKEAVLSSKQFQDWWQERRSTQPLPTDPYRAFMIDLSLTAKIENRPEWEKQPNRSDVLDVDYPAGRSGPRGKRWSQNEPVVAGKQPKESQIERLAVQQIETSRGLKKKTQFVPLKAGPLRSAALVGAGLDFSTMTPVLRGTPHAFIGVKGKSKGQRRAATAHEMGHITHAQLSFGSKEDKAKLAAMGIDPYGSQGKYYDEQTAWKLGKKSMQALPKGERSVAFWTQAYALKTYRSSPKSTVRKGKKRDSSW